MATHHTQPDCLLCALSAGDAAMVGDFVLEDAYWFAGVLPGYEVPGWIVCGMKRHGEGPDSMNSDEAASVGPFVQRLSAALRHVTGAVRLYFVAFGEEYPHLHFMVVPRVDDSPETPRGVAHLARRSELVDIEAARATAQQLIARLSN